MPRLSFRAKLFLAAFSAAVIALAVAGFLVSRSTRRQIDTRIETTLVANAKLASELLGRTAAPAAADPVPDLDAEADRLGDLLGARVTFIARDGRVVGDSSEPLSGVRAMENHLNRPEVVAARTNGLGRSRRFSATLGIDMLYVAAPVNHPAIGFVRVALPLTDVRQQLAGVLRAVLTALGIALAGAALLAFVISMRLGRRVGAIAAVAERYRRGDLTPPQLDFGDDELGTVARALDHSVQELGGRLADLARDRGRMAAILAGMIEGVVVVDLQGRLQLANGAARDMLAFDPSAVGRPYVESIRHPGIAELVAAALAGVEPQPIELAPPRDASRTMIARATPAGAGGANGVVLVLHDITELRRADRVRRDFVANVSHELRTPLTAIRGYVDALSETDVDPADAREFLAVIMRNTRRMERLVIDLLHLARLDAGQETLAIGPCQLPALIDAAIADVQPTIAARGQRVETEFDPAAATVLADPVKLQDVLRNLLSNASIYSPAETPITVRTSRHGERVAIEVLDRGPGIPPDDLSRVFERFYRVDKSRGGDPGGTGLGLAIVKHIVEQHGGSVKAANRAGGGAAFTVDLASSPLV